MSQNLLKKWNPRLWNSLIPFGIGKTKPNHYWEMIKVLWENRNNLRYGWKVLTNGVCDGCALGVAGLHDWTMDGVHLCMVRLKLMRLNTMPALDVRLLEDLSPSHPSSTATWHCHMALFHRVSPVGVSLPRHSGSSRGVKNQELRELGRLPYPLIRKKGDNGFKRITWDEAYQTIAQKIRGTSPDRLAFYLTSRGITNEVYYVAQKVARFLGTNNIDNSARICHSPSTGALKSAVGASATTCSYADWFGTDLIIFFGSNAANDQPVTMKYLYYAKKAGAKVVCVNPFREPGMENYWVPSVAESAIFGTKMTDEFFLIHTGGDIAFLNGVLKHLVEKTWWDEDFVKNYTAGFEELKNYLHTQNWEMLEKYSGSSRTEMQKLAEMIHHAKTAILVWSMGITQHSCGSDTVRAIINLALTKGFVGRINCGLMPIRGHSGVQGGAEMGAYATVFPGGKAINEENAKKLSELYESFEAERSHPPLVPVPSKEGGQLNEMPPLKSDSPVSPLPPGGGETERGGEFHPPLNPLPLSEGRLSDETPIKFSIPDKRGLTAVEMIHAAAEGKIDVLYQVGGNFVDTLPDPKFVEQAIAKVPLRVHQDIILTKQMLIDPADTVILLPAKTRYEQRDGGTETTTERRIIFSPEIPGNPVGEARSEWEVLMELAEHVYPERKRHIHFNSGWEIREEIAKVVDFYDGIQHLKKSGDQIQWGGKRLCEDWKFNTLNGKANFSVVTPKELGLGENQFIVSTRRGKQFNSMIQEEKDALTGAYRDSIFMSPEDAQQLGIKNGDRVTLKNSSGSFQGRVMIVPITPKNLQVHWPEGNVLITGGVLDKEVLIPDYNAVVEMISHTVKHGETVPCGSAMWQCPKGRDTGER